MSMRSLLRQTSAVRAAVRSTRSLTAVPAAMRAPTTSAPARASARCFNTSAQRAEEHESPWGINSLDKFTEEEEMLRDAGTYPC